MSTTCLDYQRVVQAIGFWGLGFRVRVRLESQGLGVRLEVEALKF